MRVADAVGYHEPRDAISHDWLRFLQFHGIDFFLVANVEADLPARLESEGATHLLLTNGNDVGSCPARDQAEAVLMGHAVQRRMPVLGVCRGLHLVNSYFGGSIVSGLGSETSAVAHIARTHEIRAATAADAERWGFSTIQVNSFHDQGVTEATLGTDLRAFAIAPDGVIEGIEHASLPIFAVQWHPERGGVDDPLSHRMVEMWAGQS